MFNKAKYLSRLTPPSPLLVGIGAMMCCGRRQRVPVHNECVQDNIAFLIFEQIKFGFDGVGADKNSSADAGLCFS